ncbi:ASPIC/UnbV domain-containing protein [Candidatus Poribacteria bacterium]|nr:ASPIC/UnbV domain-containing protein [Candidatus Poribacteria bacterium]
MTLWFGSAETINSIEIHWLGGKLQQLENVSTNRLIQIVEN